MAIQRGPKIVTSGLVLALDAANKYSYPTTGTSWYDLSGYNKTGTLTNSPTFSAQNMGSIAFNGVNQYARTTDLTLTGNETTLTISCWFKPATVSAIVSIVALGDDTNYKRRMFLQRDTRIEANGQFADYSSALGILSANTWSNVTIVYPSLTVNTIQLYNNGSLISGTASGTSATLSTFTNKKVTVCGNNAATPGEYGNGSIGNVLIYNRNLSANEVLQNFNATRARFGI